MKLGIIGSGNIVVDCLDAVKNIEGIELAGICVREKSIDKGKELAEKYSISKIYTDYEELLKDENIDTVYLGIINSMHYEYCKKALESGKNVICEKPFTSNIRELKELIDLAKSKNLFLFEAITMIYSPNFNYLKNNLNNLGVWPKPTVNDTTNDLFNGKSFVITGSLSKPREEFKKIIEDFKGTIEIFCDKNVNWIVKIPIYYEGTGSIDSSNDS